MAYYLGISNAAPEQQQQAQPFTNLGQQSLQVGGGMPIAQNPVGGNALLGSAANAAGPRSPTTAMGMGSLAGSFGDVPDIVKQASQRYNAGSAGFGDPSASLFQKGLLNNYNQWESAYEKPGEEFVPWALRAGSGYQPGNVDLFGTVSKTNYGFNSPRGTLSQSVDNYDPVSGQYHSQASTNPAFQSLSRNYMDLNKDYLANQFGQWTQMGASNLPAQDAYLKQYYESLMPALGAGGAGAQNKGFWDWLGHGVNNGILSGEDGDRYNRLAQKGPGGGEEVTGGYGSMPGYGGLI